MAEYHKIQTLFKRDVNNIIMPGEFTTAEFELLKDIKWECTEKIDGMNTRIELDVTDDGFNMAIKGRTERANIPKHLLERLHFIFDNVNWCEIFDNALPGDHITLYGEGYGMKIQKGGNYIKDGVDFIMFDVKFNHWWLQRMAVEEVANRIGVQIVPLIGFYTIQEAIEIVKKGFVSKIAENKEYIAEGLVLRTVPTLLDRKGDRIITKLKYMDFKKYYDAYGSDPVTQKINPHYIGLGITNA